MAGGRDVNVNVNVDSDTRGLDKAAHGLDDVAKSADGADRSLARLSKGHQALDAEIGKVAYSAKALRAEFAKSGDLGLLGDIDKQERSLKRLQTQLAKLGEEGIGKSNKKNGGLLDFALDEWIAKIAKGTASGIGAGIDAGASFAKDNKVAAALAAGIVVSAPAIGAALNAAMLLGIGAGGIAAGIVGAVQDPRVKGAWSGFGDFLKTGLADAAGSFVGPMERGAVTARAAMSQVFTGMSSGIAALSGPFERLISGLAGMATRIDFASAFRAAAPLVDKLAEELPRMGDALNDFLQSMERGGKGAQQGLHDLVTVIDAVVISTGYLVEGLSKAWDFIRNNPIGKGAAWIIPGLGPLTAAMDLFGDKGKKAGEQVKAGADEAATALGGTAYAAWQAQVKVDDLNTAIGNLVSQQLSAKSTHLAFNQSLLDMKTAVGQNGTALDDHTAKGIANQQALIKMAQAAEADRQSVLQQSQDVGKATAVFDDHMNQIYDVAKALGLDKQQVDNLIGSIRAVPHDTEANIALKNAGKTQDDIREINRGLNTLDGKTVSTYVRNNIITVYDSYQASPGPVRGRIGAFAKGGLRKAAVGMFIPASDPGTVLTGEPQTGGEWLIPARGISTSRAMTLGKAAMSSYGLDVVPRGSAYASPPITGGGGRAGGSLNVTVSAASTGTPIDQAMAQAVMHLIRTGQIQLTVGSDNRVAVG